MAQKQTKKAEQGKEPLKCTWKNCQKLQTGDGEFCGEHITFCPICEKQTDKLSRCECCNKDAF